MDAQLRVAATSLLPEIATAVAPQAFAEPVDEISDFSDVIEDGTELTESEDADATQAAAWEPGKHATLVETTSSDLIRRFDAPTETGGVSGLERRPRIATHGVLAQATSDAMAAEIVYEDADRQTEWVGTVATKTEDAITETVNEEQQDGRRQALESYRSKLSGLQAQLRQLSTSSDASGGDLSDDAAV